VKNSIEAALLAGGGVGPRIALGSDRMACQTKNLHLAIPDSLSLKGLSNGYGLDVGGFAAVGMADGTN